MGALQQIEALIANTSTDNEVKAGGDYWYQPTGGIQQDGDYTDEGQGWIVKNTLDVFINGTLVFSNIEEVVVNYSPEQYKIKVIEQREEYLLRMLTVLIAEGY